MPAKVSCSWAALPRLITDTTFTTVEADLTHRAHAVIEQVFADLISGPLAHLPSGRFGANGAWLLYAAMAHNLTRAAGTLTGRAGARARGGTLRRQIANVPPAWPITRLISDGTSYSFSVPPLIPPPIVPALAPSDRRSEERGDEPPSAGCVLAETQAANAVHGMLDNQAGQAEIDSRGR